MNSKEVDNKRIDELDALRGLAAIMVVLFHFTLVDSEEFSIFSVGSTGVDLFFVISGFVIIMTIEKCKNILDFIISRFSRLYPAYWVCVTITAIAILLTSKFYIVNKNLYGGLSLKKYIINMTMFQHWLKVRNIDGPYWTLSVELNFYIFMLILFIINKLNKIERVGLVLTIMSFLYGVFYESIKNVSIFHILLTALPLLAYFPLFYAGIVLYKMKYRKKTLLRYVILILCFIIQAYLYKKVHHNKRVLDQIEYSYMLTIIMLFILLFLNDKLKFIVNKISTKFGYVSYSLYLIHQFICIGLLMPIMLNIFNLNLWLSAFISISTVIILAISIQKYIEKPASLFIRKNHKKYIEKVNYSLSNSP